MIDKAVDANCYTYSVNVIVHVIAKSEPEARKELDEKGGVMTSREVTLLDSISLYNGKKNE